MRSELNSLGQPVGIEVANWVAPAIPAREIMQGKRCRLEPLNAARHGNALFAANSLDLEGKNWTYLPYGPYSSFADYNTWLIGAEKSTDTLFFAIIDIATEKAVGLASYLRIEPQNGSIEVGHLNFSPLMQATVIATEAMYLMMEKAFSMGYRRYEWKCNALNAPSRRSAQRLGFSYEGVFRQSTVIKGRNRDTAWYAAIDSEWPELNAAFSKWLDDANFDENGKQKTVLSELTAPILKRRG